MTMTMAIAVPLFSELGKPWHPRMDVQVYANDRSQLKVRLDCSFEGEWYGYVTNGPRTGERVRIQGH